MSELLMYADWWMALTGRAQTAAVSETAAVFAYALHKLLKETERPTAAKQQLSFFSTAARMSFWAAAKNLPRGTAFDRLNR